MKHVIIGRGKYGWHSNGTSNGNKCSSSGGNLEYYLSEAENGTYIYDAMDADLESFTNFVYSGPMVDPTLEPGTVNKFNDTKTLIGMLPGLEGGFRSLATLALGDITSLDYVAPDVYMCMLKEQVTGVKVGKVYDGKVVWE